MTLLGDLWRVAYSGRRSRRALASSLRLRGLRGARRWPFLWRDAQAAREMGLEDALALQACRSSRVHAVVVGAFDGEANDPGMPLLQALDAHVLLLEPQPRVAQALAERHARDKHMTVVQAAVDTSPGHRVLYTVDEALPDAPAWVGQIASFDLAHVLKHAAQVPGLAEHVREERVPTVTWSEVLARVPSGRVDYLQIDVEGHEAALLRAFPWSSCKPGVIFYEVHHMEDGLRSWLAGQLRDKGYVLVPDPDGWNDLAVRA